MSFGSMAACLSAMSDDAPQSRRQRKPPDSKRMQVWRRPPLPKASPLPRNRTRTPLIALRPTALSPPRARGFALEGALVAHEAADQRVVLRMRAPDGLAR